MGKVSRLGLDATYNYHVLCCTDLSIDTGIVLSISEFARSQRKGKMSFETGNAKSGTERKKKKKKASRFKTGHHMVYPDPIKSSIHASNHFHHSPVINPIKVLFVTRRRLMSNGKEYKESSRVSDRSKEIPKGW